MRRTLQSISALALLGTIGPPVLFLAGNLELAAMKGWMAVATLAWFVATPAWMEKGDA
jgi:hypothetical protein